MLYSQNKEQEESFEAHITYSHHPDQLYPVNCNKMFSATYGNRSIYCLQRASCQPMLWTFSGHFNRLSDRWDSRFAESLWGSVAVTDVRSNLRHFQLDRDNIVTYRDPASHKFRITNSSLTIRYEMRVTSLSIKPGSNLLTCPASLRPRHSEFAIRCLEGASSAAWFLRKHTPRRHNQQVIIFIWAVLVICRKRNSIS